MEIKNIIKTHLKKELKMEKEEILFLDTTLIDVENSIITTKAIMEEEDEYFPSFKYKL